MVFNTTGHEILDSEKGDLFVDSYRCGGGSDVMQYGCHLWRIIGRGWLCSLVTCINSAIVSDTGYVDICWQAGW